MKFVTDAQLPTSLAKLLRELGHDAISARDLGLKDASDGVIWWYAKSHGFAIITKDTDFATLSLRHGQPPKVVWLRIGNCPNKTLLLWVRTLWPTIYQRLQDGDALVEVT